MKMLFCGDVRLGAINNENLSVEQSRKWQATLKKKLHDLFDEASIKNIKYVAFFGQVFAQERVSETIIDDFFSVVLENKNTQVLLLVGKDEYDRLNYRKDIPDNLHLVNMQDEDSYSDDIISLHVSDGFIKLKLSNNEIIQGKKANGNYKLKLQDKGNVVASFEPIGFDDVLSNSFGYSLLEWSENSIDNYQKVNNQTYSYKSVELKIFPENNQNEILSKILSLLTKFDSNTFLRLTITGKLAFGINLSVEAIKKQLENKIFYVEVYDNTVMNIDEEEFENDISLRSEFVKLALQDDSLSESERNKVISCGWNVLSGKEVSD